MTIEPQQLKAYLKDFELIKDEQFDEVLKLAEKTGKKVEEVLITENIISPEKLIEVKAYILGIPFVNLEKEKIEDEVLKMIPEPIARSNNIVAFRKKGNNLEVAMLDPEDLRTIEFIKKTADFKILPRLTTPESIKNILCQYQKTLEAEFGDIIKKDADGIKTVKEGVLGEDKEDLQKMAEDLPIVRIVDTLMKHAILGRASDIHIEPTKKDVVVRYRIDGVLKDAMILPK